MGNTGTRLMNKEGVNESNLKVWDEDDSKDSIFDLNDKIELDEENEDADNKKEENEKSEATGDDSADADKKTLEGKEGDEHTESDKKDDNEEGENADEEGGEKDKAQEENEDGENKDEGDENKDDENKDDPNKKEDESEDITLPDNLKANLDKFFPDRELKSDNDYLKAWQDRTTFLEEYHEKGKKLSDKLIELSDKDDLFASALDAMFKEDITLRAALAKYIDPADLMAEPDDTDYEQVQKNREEREAQKTELENKQKDFQKNLEQSEIAINTFSEEKNWDESQKDGFINNISSIIEKVAKGNIDRNFLNMMEKAINYDKAVQEAEKNGETKGKNQKIVAKKGEEMKKKGDGMPNISGQGANERTKKTDEVNSHFKELAEELASEHVKL